MAATTRKVCGAAYLAKFLSGMWLLYWGDSERLCSTKYYYGDQIKEGEMCGTCSTHRTHDKCVQYFGCKTWM